MLVFYWNSRNLSELLLITLTYCRFTNISELVKILSIYLCQFEFAEYIVLVFLQMIASISSYFFRIIYFFLLALVSRKILDSDQVVPNLKAFSTN